MLPRPAASHSLPKLNQQARRVAMVVIALPFLATCLALGLSVATIGLSTMLALAIGASWLVGRTSSMQATLAGVQRFATGRRTTLADPSVSLAQALASWNVTAENDEVKQVASRLVRQACESGALNQQFLATMSHELRTPLTAVLGFADLISQRSSDVDARYAAETIERNGRQLLGMVNDILDLARVESHGVELEHEWFDPLPVIGEVLDAFQARLEERGLWIKLDAAGPMPLRIFADRPRFKQILRSVIDNAVKFTESGGVNVRLATHREAQRYLLFVDVTDTGIGIEPEQMKQLFCPFMQGDSSSTRRHGGIGLGLAISGKLAEMLGGGVELVASEPGLGSTFRISVDAGPVADLKLAHPRVSRFGRKGRSQTLRRELLNEEVVQGSNAVANDNSLEQSPVPSVTEPAPETVNASFGAPSKQDSTALSDTKLQGLRVLVAEDGPDNQRLIRFILEKVGVQVTLVDNGRDALEKVWAAHVEKRPFNCVLMDMRMPVMSGYDATRQLRARGYSGKIIALTANALTGDRDECLAAGCDEYLTKPIDRHALWNQLSVDTERSPNASTHQS